MKNEEIVKVVQARIAGEPIQHRRKDANPKVKWRDCTGRPLWDFLYVDYRIKPEPRKFIIYGNSIDNLSTYVAPDSPEVTIKTLKNNWEFVFEVTEDV